MNNNALETNWYKIAKNIISSKENHILELNQWINVYNKPNLGLNDIISLYKPLRDTINEMMKNMHLISDLFRSLKNMNQITLNRILEHGDSILADIHNMRESKNLLENIRLKIKEDINSFKNELKYSESVQSDQRENFNHSISYLMGVLNSVEYLLHIDFNDMQINRIDNAIKNPNSIESGFAQEMNYEGTKDVLTKAIYEKNPTLTVIREVLQNSVDSVNQKKQNSIKYPRIDILASYDDSNNYNRYSSPNDQQVMDIIIKDNGIGMDWNTLSTKFFVIASSGKDSVEGAGGGFGIANAVIQETPRFGWSIKTNNIQSGKFHKDIYFGTPNYKSNYKPDEYKFKDTDSIQGVTLSLFGLPAVSLYQISNICKKYATSGKVNIFLNGTEVVPLFKLNELEKIDDDLSAIYDIAKNKAEKKVIEEVVENDLNSSLANRIGNLEYKSGNTKTNIEFYLNHLSENSTSGSLFVYLNGQFQYDENLYCPLSNIICSITTNARARTDEYPMDAGRKNIRSPYKEEVENIVETLKEYFNKISESKLFKDGLNIYTLNSNLSPIYLGKENKEYNVETVLNDAIRAFGSDRLFNQSEEKLNKEEVIHILQEYKKDIQLTEDRTDEDTKNKTEIINTALEEIIHKRDEINSYEDLKSEVMKEISSPIVVAVQKNFVSQDVSENRIELTKEINKIWRESISIIVDATRQWWSRQLWSPPEKYVTGVIFSNEVLALYSPAKTEVESDALLINPLTICSLVDPILYEKVIIKNNNTIDERYNNSHNETPINRLSNFIFHTAIHEVTHLFFPDYAGSSENFHENVSTLENFSHFYFKDVRSVVKENMPTLKSNVKKLINSIGKDINKREIK